MGHISEIYDGIGLDWQLAKAPQITYDRLQFGAKAAFVLQQEDGSWESYEGANNAELPYYSESDAQFQLFLSDYTINSALWAAINQDNGMISSGLSLLDGKLTKDDLPDSVPIHLTTSGISLFFNNLERDYGPNMPVEINYSLVRLGEVAVSGADEEI